MKHKLKKELDKKTKTGIIKPEQEPTDCVNLMIIVEKVNGLTSPAQQKMKRIIQTNPPCIKHNIYLKKQTNNNKKNGELSMLKPNETILKTCLPIRPIRGSSGVVRTDSAPCFKSLENDEFLLSHHISIEVDNPKNPNNNAVLEKAVQDIKREFLKVDPTGSLVSSASLTIACCVLNSRLGSLGLHPHQRTHTLRWYEPDRPTTLQTYLQPFMQRTIKWS